MKKILLLFLFICSKLLLAQSKQAFEYKEVYFLDNFNSKNQQLNHTDYLENSWALWGHNLSKWVQKTPHDDLIFALVDNKRTSEQLCFSSDQLYHLTQKELAISLDQDSTLNRFVLAPYDNALVCQCDSCKVKGNTKTDASGAVFKLLEKLALEYPKLSFWTLAYASVRATPKQSMPKNVGIWLSTIDVQQAQALESTAQGQLFLSQIAAWKKKITKIYIWDYVVNFDNYFDFYPVFNATQANLKSYLRNGVSGVFLHGSGYDYSAVSDLKYVVLAQLLHNPDTNIPELISKYCKQLYPSIYESLSLFLNSIENNSLQSHKKQSIYSSVSQASKRYLLANQLNNLDNQISDTTTELSLIRLKTAVLYLQLEIMRLNSDADFKFASQEKNSLVPTEALLSKLDVLKTISSIAKLTTRNEQGDTIETYLLEWQKLLNRIKKNNSFYPISITTQNSLDEDYPNCKVLQNGAFGTADYHDNWLLYSGKELILDINAEQSTAVSFSKVEIGLFSDSKHKIFLPSKIELYNGSTLITEKNINTVTNSLAEVVLVTLEIPKTAIEVSYTIKISNTHKSIAMDEIRFLK
jgi:hypothetical protein